MATNIGPKIALEGEAAFKKAISDINSNLKTLGTEMKAATSAFDKNDKSVESLTARNGVLNKQIDAQETKLGELTAMLEKSKSAYGENDKQTQKYQQAVNLTTAGLNKMERELRSNEAALAQYEAEAKKATWQTEAFQKKAGEMGESLKSVGDKLSSIGKTMSVAITAPITAAGVASFKFAADLEDAMGAADQIFKGASDSIKSWADSLNSSYGIAETEALSYANTMGAMLQNIGGLTEAEASKQSQMLVELAGDLAAMFGGSTESAVQALTGALKGNNSMLDNYGMGVNEATIKTKALEMGLIKEGEQLSLSSKQAATLALVMEQTADAQGQAAREADGASGSLRGLQTELKNIATEMGEVLLPIITPIISELKEMVKRFSEMSPETQKSIMAFAAFAAALGPVLMVAGKVVGSIGGILTAVPKISAALTAAGPAISAALAAITGPVGIAIAAAAALAAGLIYLWNTNEDFRAAVISAWETIKKAGSDLWDWLSKLFMEDIPKAIATVTEFFRQLPENIVEYFSTLPERIGYFWGMLLAGIINFGNSALNWVKTEVPKIISGIIQYFSELPGKVWEWLLQTLSSIRQWGVDISTWAAESLPGLIEEIAGFFAKLPGMLFDIGVDMAKGIWEGLESMADWLANQIKSFVGGLVSGIEDKLEMNSPSRVFAEIGENMALGLGEGFTNQMRDVSMAMNNSIPSRGVTIQQTNNFGDYAPRDGAAAVRDLNRQLGKLY